MAGTKRKRQAETQPSLLPKVVKLSGAARQEGFDSDLQRRREKERSSKKEETKPDLHTEISVCTSWASLLDDSSPGNLVAEQLIDGQEVWLVDGLLSMKECSELISGSEEHGFGGTDFVKSYRGNLRLTAKDGSLADAIWRRLQPLLPASVRLDPPEQPGDESWWSYYPNAGGVWRPSGLNECWRVAKYYPGDQFACHADGAFERTPGAEMSMFTVNIYLNAGFRGGRTRFYLTDDPYFGYRSDFGKPDFEVTPKVGSCLLFRQPPGRTYWHDGEKLRSGIKYLLRSDAMYRKQ